MARTKVVIGYSPNQSRRRWVIVPQDTDPADWDERIVPDIQRRAAPGEATLTEHVAEYHRIGPDEILKRFLGRPPADDRHLLLNGNNVVGIIHADPAIDTVPFRNLVPIGSPGIFVTQ